VSSAAEFRRRAFFEARRYGGDAWIFVRELLQNSRDAGATRVDLEVVRRGGADRVVCRDDGCGMTFDHAKRYLFTLYASSKTDRSDTAGRFGIGFWSVLRFKPDRIVIRSAPDGADSWELRLSGDLSEIERRSSALGQGTEIELIRAAEDGDPAAAVWDAVRRDARHLRRQGGDDEILDVRVNGRRATEEIDLDPPSLDFARGDLRGAVALADRPEVDLLAHGLRVRTAATLDELLTQPRRRRRRPPDPDHLVPRVILDSRRLQVLMARGDARTDRELRRLVSFGRRAVRRLVRGQLDRTAGLGPAARAAMRLGEAASSRWAAGLGAGLMAMTAVVAVAWWFSARTFSGDLKTAVGSAVLQPRGGDPGSILDVRAQDRYRGPAVTQIGMQTKALRLSYRPSETDPMLAVFRIAGLDDGGRTIGRGGADTREEYRGAVCSDRCTEIVLELDGSSERIRLPVPTGHLLDPDSLRITGGPAVLEEGRDGLPELRIDGGGGRRVEYRTGEGVDGREQPPGRWPALPDEVEDLAVRLEPLRAEEVVQAATAWVQRRLAYDTSADTVARHRQAVRDGRGMVDRCLEIGAGDCDVLNAVLASIVHRAGVPVRMAVGFVGSGGRALPGLHAWVEFPGSDGVWRWADASRGAAGRTADPAAGADARPAAGGSESTTAKESDHPAEPETSRWLRPVGAGLLVLVVIGAIMANRSRLSIGDVRLADEADVAGLLRGALSRPESYREIPALFRRRVVPLIAGRPLSLEGARSLARRGRLAAGTASSTLARTAGARRRAVIDTSRPEGRAVAGVLGAVDLDRWQGMIDRGGTHPLMRRLETEAAAVGLAWDLGLSADAGGAVHVLDGRLGGGKKDSALVALDPAGDLWHRVLRLEDRAPAAAALLLADEVVDSMPAKTVKTRRLLARLAAAAVSERAERPS
jgi:hypothetical protein